MGVRDPGRDRGQIAGEKKSNDGMVAYRITEAAVVGWALLETGRESRVQRLSHLSP